MDDTALPALDAPGRYGAASPRVTISTATIAGAWNVQGDATRRAFVDAIRELLGIELPRLPNTTARSEALAALWLGPRSWLVVAGGESPLTDFAVKRESVNRAGGALFDVSAARVAWTLSGPCMRDVLAGGCPLDLDPRVFRAGDCAQSLFGHVNVLIEQRNDEPVFAMMVARSFARDIAHSLAMAALQHGFEVLPPAPYR
jgi:sarcosine oxidase subunit gamma